MKWDVQNNDNKEHEHRPEHTELKTATTSMSADESE